MVLLLVSPGVTHAAAVILELHWGWVDQDGLTFKSGNYLGLLAGTPQFFRGLLLKYNPQLLSMLRSKGTSLNEGALLVQASASFV